MEGPAARPRREPSSSSDVPGVPGAETLGREDASVTCWARTQQSPGRGRQGGPARFVGVLLGGSPEASTRASWLVTWAVSTSTAHGLPLPGDAGELGALPAGARAPTTGGHASSLRGRGLPGPPDTVPENLERTASQSLTPEPKEHETHGHTCLLTAALQRPACPRLHSDRRSPLEEDGRVGPCKHHAGHSPCRPPDCTQQPSHQGKDTALPPVWGPKAWSPLAACQCPAG